MNFFSRIQLKTDIASNWENDNPIILKGELAIVDMGNNETRFKIGDGVKTYNELPFQDDSILNLLNNKVSNSLTINKMPLTENIELSASDVGALPDTTTLANLTGDATHRVVTDEEKVAWNAKSNFSGSYNDLADKPSIPSISGLATETYVNTQIATIPKVNVVQNTGSSTTDAMSQAAVTNALEERKVFYVNMADVEIPDAEYPMVQCDKTWNQVVEAYNAGRPVYAQYVNADGILYILPLIGKQDGMLVFMLNDSNGTMTIAMEEEPEGYGMLETIDMFDLFVDMSHLEIENPHNITPTLINAVPTSRTINDHPLSDNIELTASDVGALPLAGGTMTGSIVINEGTMGKSTIVLGANGKIIDDSGSNRCVLGRSDGNVLVGIETSYLTLRGKDTRPTYNGSNMALQSDIPTVPELTTENWTFTLEDGSTVTRAVYVG